MLVELCVYALPLVWYPHSVPPHGKIASHGLWRWFLPFITVQRHAAIRLNNKHMHIFGQWQSPLVVYVACLCSFWTYLNSNVCAKFMSSVKILLQCGDLTHSCVSQHSWVSFEAVRVILECVHMHVWLCVSDHSLLRDGSQATLTVVNCSSKKGKYWTDSYKRANHPKYEDWVTLCMLQRSIVAVVARFRHSCDQTHPVPGWHNQVNSPQQSGSLGWWAGRAEQSC